MTLELKLRKIGNSLGIVFPEVAVPLGTYTGWNLRSPQVGAETMLNNMGHHPRMRKT